MRTKTARIAEIDPTTAQQKAGRPRKHVDAAARQQAYRQRMKANGLREVKTYVMDVRDVTRSLTSSVIDLSAVRTW